MTRKLILAAAGAGKSQLIAEKALAMSASGKMVLILTYTENNQAELLKKICQINRVKPSNIDIKGWFTFLLEDMIRPYQGYIFQDRISGIFLNSSDPHKKNQRTIRGRSEKQEDGSYNPQYFLTKSDNRAHTTYLSKLAIRINKEANAKALNRISEIYDAIFIDEVQDLVGWDFDVIHAISKINECAFYCVGDFRQTVYLTHLTQKKPKSSSEKIEAFQTFGFEIEHRSASWRCVQQICNIADFVHADEKRYPATISNIATTSDLDSEHLGVFVVSTDLVSEYMRRYRPVVLRFNRIVGQQLCDGRAAFNFGESKGLEFDRTLILPTTKHQKFLSGEKAVFGQDKTPKAKNSLYVAITRARFSAAFLFDGIPAIDGIDVWKPP